MTQAVDPVTEKAKRFAIRIVRLYQHLTEKQREFVLSKQVLRSGTSIGANRTEAVYACSGKDFLQKMKSRLVSAPKPFTGLSYCRLPGTSPTNNQPPFLKIAKNSLNFSHQSSRHSKRRTSPFRLRCGRVSQTKRPLSPKRVLPTKPSFSIYF